MADIALEHVTKRYRDVVAVKDVSLDILDGELMCIVGPSGCGKTTVLRLIAGLERPDSGSIRIDGRVVDAVPPGKRDVAMVFEDYALYPHLAVRDNLGFALRLRHTPAEEIRRRVSAVSGSMELERILGRKPPTLATGEAQHVAVSRAIVREHPTVFLFDDALSHLDARQRLEARAELGRLHRELGSTIVSVTHDQAEAMAIGTRVAVMNEGSLVQVGPPRTLYEQPADVFVAGFVGSPPMNLLEMTFEPGSDGPMLHAGSLRFPLPAARLPAGSTGTGDRFIVGIRPEHLHLGAARGDAPVAFRGRCDLVEYLGRHVLVHLRVDDLVLRCFDDPVDHPVVGQIVEGHIAMEHLHLFDATTGRAVSTRWLQPAGAAAPA